MAKPFNNIEDAVRDIKRGKFVILVDDEDRENEGDLVIAAEKVTPQAINFMARHARGLICLAPTPERVDELHPAPTGSRKYCGVWHRLHGLDRRPQRHHHGDFGGGPCHHHSCGDRPQIQADRPGASGPYLSAEGGTGRRLAPRRGKRKDQSTWRVWRGFSPPASSARS